MKYETKSGKIIDYPFIENRDQLLALDPTNKYEKIVDYLTIHGETSRDKMNKKFSNFGTRALELNRVMTSMQIIEVSGMVRLQRAIKYNTSTLYKRMYPNSNGKREKGGDYSGPTSYFKLSWTKEQ